MKTLLWAWSLALLVITDAGYSQGTVVFANDSMTRITNSLSGAPQPVRTIKLGLYVTPDLSAVSNSAALASMVLIRVTANGPIDGRFHGGMATVPFVSAGATLVFQVKAWPLNHATYEDAVAAGAPVAQSLPWVQQVGGSVTPPTMISRWGFRPFVYPQLLGQAPKVELAIERVGDTLRVLWPVGVPPQIQVNDGSGTGWQNLASGNFVSDHWEFDIQPSAAVQLFRLAQ